MHEIGTQFYAPQKRKIHRSLNGRC